MRYYSIVFCLMVFMIEVEANELKPPRNLPSISMMKKRANAYWQRASGVIDYLPLSGGTMTGSLYGTSASFSGIVHANATGANIRLYADGTGAGDGFVGAAYDGTLYMRNWDGTRGFVIKPNGDTYIQNGKFGIGTADPSYKLEAITSEKNGFRLQTNQSTVANPQLDFLDVQRNQETVMSSTDGFITGTYLASYSHHPLMLSTNHASAQVLLTTTGNLGVGTTNPSYKLEAVTSGKNGIRLQTNQSTVANPQLDFFDVQRNQETVMSSTDGSITGTYLASYSNHPLMFSTNHASAQVLLNTNGNMGIGVVNPSEKLTVNGNIKGKKIIVSQANWPDYVLTPQYPLMSIGKLADYIKEHQHLPEIPSAKEVADNGISLGDNQALLLKKIEELTLYVIDLQKQIHDLKKSKPNTK